MRGDIWKGKTQPGGRILGGRVDVWLALPQQMCDCTLHIRALLVASRCKCIPPPHHSGINCIMSMISSTSFHGLYYRQDGGHLSYTQLRTLRLQKAGCLVLHRTTQSGRTGLELCTGPESVHSWSPHGGPPPCFTPELQPVVHLSLCPVTPGYRLGPSTGFL